MEDDRPHHSSPYEIAAKAEEKVPVKHPEFVFIWRRCETKMLQNLETKVRDKFPWWTVMKTLLMKKQTGVTAYSSRSAKASKKEETTLSHERHLRCL